MKKNLFAPVVLLLFTAVMLEVLAVAAYFVGERKLFSFQDVHSLKQNIVDQRAPDAQNELFNLPTVVHPYVGYVHNARSPGHAKGPPAGHGGMSVSDYGYFDNKLPIQQRSENKFIVAFFGGSVAWWTSLLGEHAFVTELKKSHLFRDNEIIIVRTALGGYKQPQQLMTLSYLLSLGGEFDAVINLDGFNEVSLPPTSNLPKKISPYFPEYWYTLVQTLPDKEAQLLVGEIALLNHRRKTWARRALAAPLRYSVTASTLWYYYDHYLDRQIGAQRFELNTLRTDKEVEDVPYVLTGPRYAKRDDSERYHDFARMWKESSLQMSYLCAGNDIEYFHFLQPNQYVPGSKPMTEAERARAIETQAHWRVGVQKGYPELIEAGKELRAEGVNFHDLTMIFAETSEPVYEDTCCHFNLSGNAIVGEALARAVVERFERHQTAVD